MGINSDGKLCFANSYRVWLAKHSGRLNDYLNTCIDIEDREWVRKVFNENPFIGKVAVSDYILNTENIDFNRYRVIEYMKAAGHEITVTSGSKRSGKTGTSVSMIEEAYRKDTSVIKTYIGAPNAELERQGWETVATLEQMKKDAMAIQDEAAVFLGSRRGMSKYNVEFLENLPTISHKNIKNCNILSQSTKRMDIGVLDYSSTHIIKTYSDAFNLNVERGMISDETIYEFMMPRQNYIIPSNIKDWSFVRTGEFMCLMYCPLVSWYNDKVGKAFGRFDNEAQAYEFARVMFVQDEGFDGEYMAKYMHSRGLKKSKDFWNEFKETSILNAFPLDKNAKSEVKEIIKDGLIEEGSENFNFYEKEKRDAAVKKRKK